MQFTIRGLVFYFCFFTANLWLLFCSISVNIIAHNTATYFFQATGKHVTIQNTFNCVDWMNTNGSQILIVSCEVRKTKVCEICITEVFALLDQKGVVRQQDVCFLCGVCMFSCCLCGFSPACPPVSCPCVTVLCDLWLTGWHVTTGCSEDVGMNTEESDIWRKGSE